MRKPFPTSVTTRRLLAGLAAGLALTLGLSAAGSAEAATRIYRTVDENGNVVFTDVPPRPDEPGQAVELNEGSSFTPPPTPAPEPTAEDGSRMSLEQWLGNEAPPSDEEAAGPVSYQSLEIASPANDEGLRDNAGTVTVNARLQPRLDVGHAMQVLLDGEVRQTGQTSSFQLINVDRGTHSVQVRVVDANGNILIASAPTTFHLQRRSVLQQPANRAR